MIMNIDIFLQKDDKKIKIQDYILMNDFDEFVYENEKFNIKVFAHSLSDLKIKIKNELLKHCNEL